MKLETEDLDLIVCLSCREAFDSDSDIVSISESFFSKDKSFLPKTTKHHKYDFIIKKTIRYHKNCFQEMAGDEFDMENL